MKTINPTPHSFLFTACMVLTSIIAAPTARAENLDFTCTDSTVHWQYRIRMDEDAKFKFDLTDNLGQTKTFSSAANDLDTTVKLDTEKQISSFTLKTKDWTTKDGRILLVVVKWGVLTQKP